MNTTLFLISLALAVVGPLIALQALRPLLLKVLRGLCDAEGGAEFWMRSAQILALSGSVLLLLSFGSFEENITTVESLRRTLWLIFAGVFVSVGILSRNVWEQVRRLGHLSAPQAQNPVAQTTQNGAAS